MFLKLNKYFRDWIISSHTMLFHFIYGSVIFFMIIVNLIACKMVVKMQDCVGRANTKENNEKLGRLRQKVGRTEAQWKRPNIWCNTY